MICIVAAFATKSTFAYPLRLSLSEPRSTALEIHGPLVFEAPKSSRNDPSLIVICIAIPIAGMVIGGLYGAAHDNSSIPGMSTVAMGMGGFIIGIAISLRFYFSWE